jgi:hypothetical protein
MSAQILTSAKFLNEKTTEQLKSLGIEISAKVQLEALDLPEPAYGEEVMTELDEDEALLFAELYHLNEALDAKRRDYMAESLAKLGSSLRERSERDLTPENFRMSDAQEKEVHRLQQQASMLHAMLYWRLGERLDCHEFRMGVRSRGRVVKLERR